MYELLEVKCAVRIVTGKTRCMNDILSNNPQFDGFSV